MSPDIRKKAAIWLALVFVLGTATGGVFGYSLARRSYAATKTVAPSEAERRAKKLAEMTETIGLTYEQVQKADGIIKDAQTQIHAIHGKSDAEVDVVRMKARAEMRTFLTPEQLPKFEQYMKRLDEERKKQKEAQQGK
jgi:galactokinase/mevalonate kinase-like predicted kinase